MSTYAETLTDKERKRARILAYFACYFGCISEVMLDSSAIIIIYISMLCNNDTIAMLATGFTGLLNVFCLLPCAAIINKIGMKRAVSIACIAGCSGFLLMAAAPFLGSARQVAVICGCLIYCAQRSLYGAAWYPMLDAFLRPQDRGAFFGTMRYSYMILSGILFFILGKLMGKEPPMYLMQLVIGITGLLILGRMYCMLKFPENPHENTTKLKFKHALGISVRNGPLVSYSVYVCMLSLAYTSLVPLTLVYMKSYIGLPPGTVQIFSTVGIGGSITGFFCYGFLQKKLKLKKLELMVHCIFIVTAFSLALLQYDTPYFLCISGLVYFLITFATSTFLCNNSTELLALARPGNKTMAMAFQQTYTGIGVAIGRTGTAMIMGANLLAAQWEWHGATISSYQTLFLFYGVIATVLLILFPTLPAIVPKHHDYYKP